METYKQYTIPKRIWLLYFNRVLLEKGINDEKNYRMIKQKLWQCQPEWECGFGTRMVVMRYLYAHHHFLFEGYMDIEVM